MALGAFPAGSNLAQGSAIDPEGSVYQLVLPRAVEVGERVTFTARVRDLAGHWTEVRRTYGVPVGAGSVFRDGFETGSTTRWSGHTGPP